MRVNPTVIKGRLTVLPGKSSSATRIVSKSFAFNPAEISDTKANNWDNTSVAGASHPVYSWSSGGERLITFDLQLDADRSKIVKNGVLDLTDELAWYRSLVYPVAYNSTIEEVYPSKVSFSFGSFWNSVIVVVKKADIKVNYFSPMLKPLKATVSLALAEVVRESETVDLYLTGLFEAPGGSYNPTVGY